MLRWAIVFLIIAVVAALLGFWQLEGMAMQIAKLLAFVFLILFLASLILGRRTPRLP